MNEYINTGDTPEDILMEAKRLSEIHAGDLRQVSDMWSAYLGKPMCGQDVGLMMALQVIVRQRQGESKRSNFVEAAMWIRLAYISR